MHLETMANLCGSQRQKNFVFAVFSIFELGGTGMTKHLMTGPTGNSEFSFP